MGTFTSNDDSILSHETEKKKQEMIKSLELRGCKNKKCLKTFRINKEHEQEYCSCVCETGVHDAMFVPEIFTVSSREKRQLSNNVTNYGAVNTDL